MHISLTDKLDEYVREKVATGLYNNASEVIREALRLQISLDARDEAKLAGLREAIEPAWSQAEAGQFTDYSLGKTLNKLRAKT